MNCCEVPTAIEGSGGVTAIETSADGPTVSDAEPLTGPEVAVMVVVPVATVVASPWLPETLLMVATVVVEDDQVTNVVRF